MRRAFTLAIVAALTLAPSALAHITVTPSRVAPGSDVVLSFVVPNEETSATIRSVTIDPPAGFRIEQTEDKPGWRLATRDSNPPGYVWSGRIRPGSFTTFAVSVTAPQQPRALTFRASESFGSGRVLRYTPRVTVAAARSTAARDASAHELGKAALFVAIAAAALALGAGFLALGGWLKRD